MKFSTAASVAAVAITGASAQGVSGVLTPSESAPAGCSPQGDGQYQITVVKPSVAAKRDLEKRQTCDPAGNSLIISLNNGVLTDSKGRIGAIVANRQFQFDGPPAQTGSIYTGGFSICGNSSIAIGGTTEFYQCLSGEFYNLYDQSTGEQCSPVRLNTLKCDKAGAAPVSGTQSTPASQATDGQPQATSATSVVSQQPDGQPTAAPATVISQISDGQIQGPTNPAPTAPAPTVPVVSQISDGQPQATAATNGTIATATPTAPIVTGAASSVGASGAVVGVVAIAAFFL